MADIPAAKKTKVVDLRRTRESLIPFKERIIDSIEFLKSNNVYFCFLKLTFCNGAIPASFSMACSTDDRSCELGGPIVLMQDLFHFEYVERIIRQASVELTDRQLIAFNRLVDFFQAENDTNTILDRVLQDEKLSECTWASVFGTHVLRKLAVVQRMVISDGYRDRSSYCQCGCRRPVAFGDTSFGNKNVWHGSVDILLDNVAVSAIVDNSVDRARDSGEKLSTFEMNVIERIEQSRMQLIAETITFAHAMNCGLVPTIAFSKTRMKIFMYDPNNDLLYEGSEIPLFSTGNTKLSHDAIVALWLAINYEHFCRGSDESHVECGFFADFKTLVASKLRIYEKEIHFGGCKRSGQTKRDMVSMHPNADTPILQLKQDT